MKECESTYCRHLPWDSTFFGFQIARLSSTRLSSEIVEFTDDWCRTNGIKCLYFLAEADDASTIRLAEESGFNLVDIRILMAQALRAEANLLCAPEGATIRASRVDDLDQLKPIAASIYRNSRFYFDGRFAIEKCDRLYETWLENSFVDRSGVVLVAEWQGNPAGYVTCEKIDAATGQIGLLGVGAAAQGVGLGSALVSSAVNWFQSEGLNHAQVVTQARNVGAQGVYQRCGFRTSAVHLWYHRWFS